MRFNIYYDTDKKNLIRSNVSKEDTIKYLKTLTVAEKTHIYLDPIEKKQKENDKEEER